MVRDEGKDDQQKEGIWLYSNYVVQDDSGAYVWAANDKKRLEKRYVELGEYDEDLAEYEILSGLSLDDYITSSPYRNQASQCHNQASRCHPDYKEAKNNRPRSHLSRSFRY